MQIAGDASGELLPALHRRRRAREAGKARPARSGREHVVAEDPPAEVDARVAQRHHLPVEDGDDLAVARHLVAEPGVAPHERRRLRRRLGQMAGEPRERRACARVRSPVLCGLGPGERFLVVPQLLLDAARAAVGVVDELEPEGAPVDAVHRGHGRDPVPPQLGLELGARIVEPPLERVGRRVRRHLTVDRSMIQNGLSNHAGSSSNHSIFGTGTSECSPSACITRNCVSKFASRKTV